MICVTSGVPQNQTLKWTVTCRKFTGLCFLCQYLWVCKERRVGQREHLSCNEVTEKASSHSKGSSGAGIALRFVLNYDKEMRPFILLHLPIIGCVKMLLTFNELPFLSWAYMNAGNTQMLSFSYQPSKKMRASGVGGDGGRFYLRNTSQFLLQSTFCVTWDYLVYLIWSSSSFFILVGLF